MDSDTTVAVRFGTPGNVLEVQVGTVEVDVPRSIGYFGGVAAALGLGLIEPPLALFIAAVPVFKALTNTDLPRAVRVVGEVLEGAAKPVGSDAEGVIQLRDQKAEQAKVAKINPKDRHQASNPVALPDGSYRSFNSWVSRRAFVRSSLTISHCSECVWR
jgi:hypothetical protein